MAAKKKRARINLEEAFSWVFPGYQMSEDSVICKYGVVYHNVNNGCIEEENMYIEPDLEYIFRPSNAEGEYEYVLDGDDVDVVEEGGILHCCCESVEDDIHFDLTKEEGKLLLDYDLVAA